MESNKHDHAKPVLLNLPVRKLPPIPVPVEYYDAEYAAWLAKNDPAEYMEYRAIVIEAVLECFM